jgi:hypothetical protein
MHARKEIVVPALKLSVIERLNKNPSSKAIVLAPAMMLKVIRYELITISPPFYMLYRSVSELQTLN